ncbi:MAG: DNA polymerase III subunit alpha, partial [Acidobacteria bacterium]|nr:DNA polymerase III subunit alpha [Acidobacteriota bacterium]
AHVRQLYGEDNVSQIATFNVLQARSCIRDVGRVMGMSFAETDRIAKFVPETLGITLADAIKDSPRLAEAARDEARVARLLDIGNRLEGLARHCGVHAAGVVIAPRPVREIVPLYKTSRDEVVTQFDKDAIEKLGLLKMDFLGLKTLTVIDDCMQSMESAGLPVPDFERMVFDDELVYDLFCAGDTDGVFQFESPGMRDLSRTVQPRRFEEIAALNALYRPGPMQWIPEYTERKHSRKPISYIFPQLEEILAETYGVIVYQEQVMQIAVEIAGFTLARADTLRKAMGKKIKDLVDEQGAHFVEGALKKGYPKAKVEALWRQIVPFAQYGFNKSHSVAYAYVAYQTAWLKAHYREHFWAAMLSSETSNTEKLAAYVAQLATSGLRLLGPDVNTSKLAFAVEGDAIRVGLAAIKGVGEAAAEAILASREKVGRFSGAAHFLRSLPERTVNRKVIECLVRAGAFDSLHPDRSALLASYESLVEQASHQRAAIEAGQGFLFGLDGGPGDDPALPVVGTASREELLRGERDTLGFYLSGHPLERWSHVLKEINSAKVAQLADLRRAGAEHASVAGLVSGLKVRPIKEGRNQGRRIASFMLEDETGTVRVVAFADVYDQHERSLTDGAALLVEASLRSNDGDHVELSMDEAAPLEGIEARKATALLVEIDLAQFTDRAALERLHEVILHHDGRVALKLKLLLDDVVVDITPSRVTGVNPVTLVPALTAMLGPGHVEHIYSST